MSVELHGGRKEGLMLVSPPLAALQNMMETHGGPSGASASFSSVAAVAAAAAAAAGALSYGLHHQPNDSVCRAFQRQHPPFVTPSSSSSTDHSITDILFSSNSSRTQLMASDGVQAHYHHRSGVVAGPHLPRGPFTSDVEDDPANIHCRSSPSTTSSPHPHHLHPLHQHQQNRMMLEQGFGVALFHHGLQPPSPPPSLSSMSCCPPQLRSDVSCQDEGSSIGGADVRGGDRSQRRGLFWPQQHQPTLSAGPSADGLSRLHEAKGGGGTTAAQQPWTNATAAGTSYTTTSVSSLH